MSKKHFFYLLVFFMPFFFSCSKKEIGAISKNNNEEVRAKTNRLPGNCPYACTDPRCQYYQYGYCGTRSTTITLVTNSNNPYDYVGQQHNAGVDQIFPLINPASTTLDTDILAQVKSYGQTLGIDPNTTQSIYDNLVQLGYFPYSMQQELDSLGNSLAASGIISYTANNYVQTIYQYATQYLSTDTASVNAYNNFAIQLLNLETSINNDPGLSSNERLGLLSGCAVGRYSAEYWGNYLNSSASAPIAAYFPNSFLPTQKPNSTEGLSNNPAFIEIQNTNTELPNIIENTNEEYSNKHNPYYTSGYYVNNEKTETTLFTPSIFANQKNILENNYTVNQYVPMRFLKIRLPKWLKVVISDIGGAIVGIPSGWSGVITGAVGTSIITAATL